MSEENKRAENLNEQKTAIHRELEIPAEVDVKVDGKKISVKGAKGELSRDFSNARFNSIISIFTENNKFIVRAESSKRNVKAFAGTIAAHVRNMIIGVTKGFKCEMAVVYTHFPMTFSVEDNKLLIKNFIGEKGARTAKIVGGVEVKPEKTKITVTGISKEDVGQTASNIEHACKVRKKERRTFQDGCYIVAMGVDDETFVNEFDTGQTQAKEQK